MSDEKKPSRWRAILKNAVVWGAGWGALGTAVATVFRLNDGLSFPMALLDGIGMGAKIGVMGGIVGALFAAFISVAYRGKRLNDINWVRFGIVAAALAGLFVPTFLELTHFLTGGGWIPFNEIDGDMLYSAVFGGITAAGTMKLAQSGEEADPVTAQDLLDRRDEGAIGPGAVPSYSRESTPVSTNRTH